MDYEKFQQFSQMLLTPDILIVPSELRYFIKVDKQLFRKLSLMLFPKCHSSVYKYFSTLSQDVSGCVCVNPGRLTKGQVGGTYGRLLIQPNPVMAEGKRASPCIAGQVVKI